MYEFLLLLLLNSQVLSTSLLSNANISSHFTLCIDVILLKKKPNKYHLLAVERIDLQNAKKTILLFILQPIF